MVGGTVDARIGDGRSPRKTRRSRATRWGALRAGDGRWTLRVGDRRVKPGGAGPRGWRASALCKVEGRRSQVGDCRLEIGYPLMHTNRGVGKRTVSEIGDRRGEAGGTRTSRGSNPTRGTYPLGRRMAHGSQSRRWEFGDRRRVAH